MSQNMMVSWRRSAAAGDKAAPSGTAVAGDCVAAPLAMELPQLSQNLLAAGF
jgi:hypothetical protein